MRDIVKLYIKYMSRILLRVFYIFPINKKKIFFMSTMGKSYSCNPKYIYEEIIKDDRFKEYCFVWCFKNIDIYRNMINDSRTRIIRKNNLLSFFYQLLTSKVIIYNCGGFSYVPIRKKQLLLETWHGGGAYKKFGLSFTNKTEASKKGITIASNEINLFLSSSEISSKYVIKEAMGYKGKILNFGFPRNDIIINNKNNKELKNSIKKELGLDINKRIILYAPTFKGKEHKAININEEYELIQPNKVKNELKEKFNDDYVFISRGHQYAGNVYLDGQDLDLTDYPDMQKLLLITDVLITDYSSSIWDYSFTDGICIIYVPDINDYKSNERDLFTNIDTWPGIVCYSNEDIKNKIKSFNKEEYKNKIINYHKESGNYDIGNACKKTIDAIYKEIKKYEK